MSRDRGSHKKQNGLNTMFLIYWTY